MLKKINLLFSAILAISVSSFSQSEFKKITLCRNEISLSVPVEWKVKENAMHFAAYEIKYDVAVKDPKNRTSVALYVYGPLYGPKMQINDSILYVNKYLKTSDSIRKVTIEESGLKTISGIEVGYLKYTFRVNNKFGRAYGIDLFFCNKENIYHVIEITSLNKSVNTFKNVAEKIFDSIDIE